MIRPFCCRCTEATCYYCSSGAVCDSCRWFALMEIHLFTAVLIHYYDIQLLQPVPKPVCRIKELTSFMGFKGA